MTHSLETAFTRRFNIRYPLAQAGMAFAGWSPPLAIAISAAGGIGTIGAGLLPPDVVRQMIGALKAANAGPFNINFLTNFDHDEQVRICAEEQVPSVSFHWGHPSAKNIQVLKDAGVSIWEQVGRVEDAQRAVGDGIDVVIAQGHEAGGHNYQGIGTMALVPTVRDAIGGEGLLLASGGIADGRGVAAALMLGADGVWVGTRFVATPESGVHDEHRRRLVAATGDDTAFSAVFGPDNPTFNPMRVIRNRVVNEWNDRLSEIPQDLTTQPEIGTTVLGGETMTMRKFNVLLPTPDTQADWEEMPFLSGQGVGLINEVRPAGELVEQMMAQASEVLAGAGSRSTP